MRRRGAGNALPPVLYEDEYLIAFDKPSGLLVAPDRWDKSRENLMRMVHERFSPACGNVHRLDRETSGVLLCAKSKETLVTVCRAFAGRAVEKQYSAIVHGVPREGKGTVRLALSEDAARPGLMRVDESGRPAETHYEVVQRWRGYAAVQLVPVTGRTHQLRVHLSAIGCPIVADSFYGGGHLLFLSAIKPGYRFKRDRPERPLLGQLALHAERLTLKHPVTGQALTIRAPLPHDFGVAMKYLDRFASAQPPTGLPVQ